MCPPERGVSGDQLVRYAQLQTHLAAWRVAYPIGSVLTQEPIKRMLGGTVEMDGTCGGGKLWVGPIPTKPMQRRRIG
jgi:hypothetical protein